MGVYSIKPAFQRSLLPLENALVGVVRLDRTRWNHYDAQDATSNVIFASEMR